MRVVTFGEAMLRLSPPGFQRLAQAQQLQVSIAGTESNTAVALAQLGVAVTWLSRLPDNPLGHLVAQQIRAFGVDVEQVIWDADSRLGLYFVETGVAPRPTRVWYDRRGSAMSRWRPGEWDWCRLLQGASLLHATGITPALSASCLEATREALRRAHEMGVPVSFDINYRSLLWSPEEARAALEPLLSLVQVLFVSPSDARTVLDVEAPEEQVAQQVQRRYGIPTVVTPLRDQPSATQGRRYSVVATAERVWRSSGCPFEVVDPIGSGDAYNAGFLYGYLHGDIDLAMRCADALSALKHTVPGDVLYTSREDLQQLLQGASQGIVR
ncbi:MAG: sugar kinase [Armatimonadota bacterium]|nr:sugar kinase [Armatimonadota bacterium]MDW8104551.1 sugar kinase [Armatimonadota bacterium]